MERNRSDGDGDRDKTDGEKKDEDENKTDGYGARIKKGCVVQVGMGIVSVLMKLSCTKHQARWMKKGIYYLKTFLFC